MTLFADDLSVLKTETNQNEYTFSRMTPSNFLKLSSNDQKLMVYQWGLSVKEYTYYLWLMKNTPAGVWYLTLNPAEVLGIYAKDDQERMHYAKIIVKNSFDRATRELALQQAYNEAWHELYPTLKPIHKKVNFSSTTSVNLEAGDQLLLFTPINDIASVSIIKRLVDSVINHNNIILNIYFLGKDVTDEAIQAWATQLNIPVSLVKSGAITLNHDAGHFSKLTNGKAKLPFIALDRAGIFRTIHLENLGMQQ